jgi:hypothetical protein
MVVVELNRRSWPAADWPERMMQRSNKFSTG